MSGTGETNLLFPPVCTHTNDGGPLIRFSWMDGGDLVINEENK